jgi:hypothetical protein
VTIHKRRRAAVWPYWATIAVALAITVAALIAGWVVIDFP